jgi:hypothetical protein
VEKWWKNGGIPWKNMERCEKPWNHCGKTMELNIYGKMLGQTFGHTGFFSSCDSGKTRRM